MRAVSSRVTTITRRSDFGLEARVFSRLREVMHAGFDEWKNSR